MAKKIKALSAGYAKDNLCGWPGQEIAKAAFAPFASQMPVFAISGPVTDYKGKRQMLWEFTRKVLGKDTVNFAQEIGDCVSFGGKNVMEYLQCVQMILNGSVEEFHALFPPYFYGTSRVLVGHNQLGWSDGSTGSWLQEAIKTYGVLRRDDTTVPQYAGSVAKNWGGQGPPNQFITEGKKHLVKTTAMITTAEDAANALLSGYPIAVCSNQGFTMQAGSDGFHQARGTWGHCMSIIGFEDHPQYGLYFLILNSWGDVHGHLKDFTSGEDLPVGVIRAKGNVVDNMLSMQDSFAYSGFDGFPDNSDVLNKALFDMGGN
jgi:hypothetical protein